MDRWSFDAFFDYQNWMLGLYLEWEGVVLQDPFGRFRLLAVSVGPLIVCAAYRV